MGPGMCLRVCPRWGDRKRSLDPLLPVLGQGWGPGVMAHTGVGARIQGKLEGTNPGPLAAGTPGQVGSRLSAPRIEVSGGLQDQALGSATLPRHEMSVVTSLSDW